MNKKVDMMVYIGRMRPKTRAHDRVIEIARNNAKKVLVLVGSSGEPRTIKNPLTFEETKNAILAQYSDVIVEPIYDFPYNDIRWLAGVQCKISQVYEENFGKQENKSIGLIGHKKDNSSYYLNMFPSFRKYSIDVEAQTDTFGAVINATDVRNYFYNNDTYTITNEINQKIHPLVFEQMCNFMKSEEGKAIKQSYIDNNKYLEIWKVAPYPPTFVTVDAVVVQSGHVLLIKRKNNPGKGLWALPGGFVEHDLTLKQNLLKELNEETGLKVVDKVVLGSIVRSDVFDAPGRSIRGRTITHTFHIDLGYYPELPHVKGGDDAAKAKWVPIGEVKRDMMFEDHYAILDFYIGMK